MTPSCIPALLQKLKRHTTCSRKKKSKEAAESSIQLQIKVHRISFHPQQKIGRKHMLHMSCYLPQFACSFVAIDRFHYGITTF